MFNVFVLVPGGYRGGEGSQAGVPCFVQPGAQWVHQAGVCR